MCWRQASLKALRSHLLSTGAQHTWETGFIVKTACRSSWGISLFGGGGSILAGWPSWAPSFWNSKPLHAFKRIWHTGEEGICCMVEWRVYYLGRQWLWRVADWKEIGWEIVTGWMLHDAAIVTPLMGGLRIWGVGQSRGKATFSLSFPSFPYPPRWGGGEDGQSDMGSGQTNLSPKRQEIWLGFSDTSNTWKTLHSIYLCRWHICLSYNGVKNEFNLLHVFKICEVIPDTLLYWMEGLQQEMAVLHCKADQHVESVASTYISPYVAIAKLSLGSLTFHIPSCIVFWHVM